MCLEDLGILLKNPKLKLETLSMGSFDIIQNASKFFNDVGCLLKSIDDRCHVKSLNILISNQDDALSILKYLKPRVLTDIYLFTHLCFDEPFPLFRIDKLAETEQWKRAEDVYIEDFKIHEPMECFYHLRQFWATWNQVSPGMLRCLRDALSKSTNFEICWIHTYNEIEDVERIMGPEKIGDITLIYPIPNSTNYLETVLQENCIEIKKKSRD